MKKSTLAILITITLVFIITPIVVLFVVNKFPERIGIDSFRQENNHENRKKYLRKVRVLVDPGHNINTKGAMGLEYKYTVKLALELANYLSNDKRFEYFLSRESDYYSTVIKNYTASNRERLSNIYNFNLKYQKRGNLGEHNTMELYAIRGYAIENDFDVLVSIHFDNAPTKKLKAKAEGFQVIVSPYNKQFPASIELATILAGNMKEKYKTSTIITFDEKLPQNIWKYYNKKQLEKEGLSLRSLIIIGDAFESEYDKLFYKKYSTNDLPSILFEAAFIHEKILEDDNTFKDIAQRLYNSLVEFYFL